ncbi:MAG: DUF5009 domain-containing protein [candidate division KSB1 bacterium]|nr:DUF5009 domain-containing protein [candidate division KSB1 bacterium]
MHTLSARSRLVSLDVLRGLNILVMLFVNDLAGVVGVPAWMKHISPSTADGMTFVDVVFPAFLFIAGLAVPLAIDRRLQSGESMLRVVGRIIGRTGVLLFLGLMMVNSERIALGLVDPRLWNLLFYTGVCLIWLGPGDRRSKFRLFAGVAMLALAVFLYRGENSTGLIQLRSMWWGILGLIGWAYLVTGVLYLLLRGSRLGLAAAVVLLYCLYFADRAQAFGSFFGLSRWVNVGSMLGSHAAIMTSGALLGTFFSSPESDKSRLKAALGFAAVSAAAAYMLHALHGLDRMFIFNKNAATPPWCLLSSAWAAAIWAAVYWLVEVKQIKIGVTLLSRAGQNALFAFILGPIAYNLFELLPEVLNGFSPWGYLGKSFPIGLFRSLVFALSALLLTADLQRRKLFLRV